MPVMMKEGPSTEIVSEVEYLRNLNSNGYPIAPIVYYAGPTDGSHKTWFMVMEILEAYPEVDLLLFGARTLEERVWKYPAISWTSHWPVKFMDRFGFQVPEWVFEPICLIHGDPTLANMRFDGKQVRFIDPKPPGNGIPPLPSVDRGKILQSYLGWERALYTLNEMPLSTRMDHLYAGEGPFREQVFPFPDLDDLSLRRATFWCMIHFLRIYYRESYTDLGMWAADNGMHIAGRLGLKDELRLGLGRHTGRDSGSELSGL